MHEIAGADFILAIGTNTTETHPVLSLQVRKAVKEGAKLVVADPRRIELADIAEIHLQHKSGSDLALLNAMANVIIEEGLWNKEFVEQRTEDFEALSQSVKVCTPEWAAKITGVSPEIIRETARAYAGAEKASILYTMGITQHICGTDNVLAIANLALLTGQIGRENTGVNPLRGQNNVQGACDMGALPNVYPGYQAVSNPEIQQKFEKAWGVEMSPKAGLVVGEMMDAAYAGTLKGLFVIGENPLMSDPDSNHVIKAMEKIDFLVVQDLFMTETAEKADVILPAASFAEKNGTFTNTERRVQRVRKAVEPIGDSKPDWEILVMLSNAMGYPMQYGSPGDIMKEINTVTPQYGGITFERLEKQGLQWPCPDVDHPGTKFLHKDKFARGKGKFHPVSYIDPDEMPDAEYPYVLTTGRRLFHYHTGSMSRRAKGLAEAFPEEYLEINPKDALKLEVETGEKVRVASRRGEIEIPIRVTERIQPGLVFASFHFRENWVNKLTNDVRDPKAKIPEFKVSAVKIEKVV